MFFFVQDPLYGCFVRFFAGVGEEILLILSLKLTV